MATANFLNKLFYEYTKDHDSEVLAQLLTSVRTFALSKFSKDPDREDIAQSCVINVWRRIDPTVNHPLEPFDSTKSSFYTWLEIVCRTKGADFKKTRIRQDVSYLNNSDLDRANLAQKPPYGVPTPALHERDEDQGANTWY